MFLLFIVVLYVMANNLMTLTSFPFSILLAEIEENETNYAQRERLVYQAFAMASQLGYKCGVRFDPTDNPPWPVFCIHLPNGIGEVSWHCPPYKVEFSGYDTEEKYKRCRRYVDMNSMQRIAEVKK